jgi:drug/metabolite transporter (DMT)-like permease
MPPLFVAWGRWMAGIALLAPFLIWRVGVAGLATRDLELHCLRGLFHTSGYALWYEAVSLLPLATMAAVGFTGPIFVTFGAMLFLGERVHRRRWIAVAIGFVGMLVVVRPGLAAIGPGMSMAIASVPLVAGSNLVAKKVPSRDTPAVVVFWQSLIGALFYMPLGLWCIVWAAVMDVALWGKTADAWTFVGAAIIVAATSYIARREALMARSRR